MPTMHLKYYQILEMFVECYNIYGLSYNCSRILKAISSQYSQFSSLISVVL